MKGLVTRHRHSLREFAKFACVGALNTLVDFAVFFALTGVGVPYVAAQVVSYSCGAANSYLLNKVWTFRTSGLSYREILRFTAVNLASLGVSVLCLRLLYDAAGMGLTAAKTAATGCALAANFVGNKLWVFRQGDR